MRASASTRGPGAVGKTVEFFPPPVYKFHNIITYLYVINDWFEHKFCNMSL